MSNTIPIQIRVDKATKEKASELFKDLGTDMSGAVNMFLRQCVRVDGLPFEVKRTRYSEELREAIEEVEEVLRDPDAPVYETFEEYQTAMDRLVAEDE